MMAKPIEKSPGCEPRPGTAWSLEYLSMRIKTRAKQRMTNDFHFSHFPLLTLGFVEHAKKSISGALAHAMPASCDIA